MFEYPEAANNQAYNNIEMGYSKYVQPGLPFSGMKPNKVGANKKVLSSSYSPNDNEDDAIHVHDSSTSKHSGRSDTQYITLLYNQNIKLQEEQQKNEDLEALISAEKNKHQQELMEVEQHNQYLKSHLSVLQQENERLTKENAQVLELKQQVEKLTKELKVVQSHADLETKEDLQRVEENADCPSFAEIVPSKANPQKPKKQAYKPQPTEEETPKKLELKAQPKELFLLNVGMIPPSVTKSELLKVFDKCCCSGDIVILGFHPDEKDDTKLFATLKFGSQKDRESACYAAKAWTKKGKPYDGIQSWPVQLNKQF